MTKPSVYTFQDFSSLFAAYAEWMKLLNPKFSWRWLAKRLQLRSHTHLINFANGRKTPTDDMLAKISDLFGFTLDEYVYVKSLLGLQTAKNDNERGFFQTKLAETKRATPAVLLDPDAFEAIAEWYHLVIYAMVSLPGFQSDPQWIASNLAHPVTPERTAEAIERLLRLGLLVRDEGGKLTRALESFFTTHNVPSLAITSFHKQMLERAAQAIDSEPVPRRLFLGYTMAVDSRRMEEAQNLLVEFRARFIRLMEGGQTDSVYHLALHYFPATKLHQAITAPDE